MSTYSLFNSTSRVILSIGSRCLVIRVAVPVIDEICGILKTVATIADIRLAIDLRILLKKLKKSQQYLRQVLLTL